MGHLCLKCNEDLTEFMGLDSIEVVETIICPKCLHKMSVEFDEEIESDGSVTPIYNLR